MTVNQNRLSQFLGDYAAEVLNHDGISILIYTIDGPGGDDTIAVRLTTYREGQRFCKERMFLRSRGLLEAMALHGPGKLAAEADVKHLLRP